MEKSVAEGQILRDAIRIGGIHGGCATKPAAAFWGFALGQVAPARAGAENFSASRDLKTFGHGLSGFDAFGSSHKIFVTKERELYVLLAVVASDF
jgi:uncharacterized protein (DUF697 family)